MLYFLECVGLKNFNRKEIENEFLRKIMVINNRNWRNAFITLSSLGIIDNNKIKIVFDEPQRAITKGQSVVMYNGDVVVGGGIIC